MRDSPITRFVRHDAIQDDLVIQAPAIVPTLLSLAKSTRAYFALLLAEVDLHPGQDQLLQRLQPGEPVDVSTLAEQLAVRPSTVSKMLDRLIEKQLVSRASHRHDARRTMVELTGHGEEARRSVQAIWDRLDGELQAALPADQVTVVRTSLECLDDVLSAKLRRLR